MRIRLPFCVLRVKYGCILSSGILNYTWRQVLNAFPKISKLWWSMVRMKASTASSGRTSSADTWSVSMELVCLGAWGGRCPDLTWLYIYILFGGGRRSTRELLIFVLLELSKFGSRNTQTGGHGITSCHTSWPLGWWKWVSSQVMRISPFL